MKSPLQLLCTLALAVAFLPALARSQSAGAADANRAAYELFSKGDFQGAVAAYEKMLKDYPTDASVPLAEIQLALCYFSIAQYDQALTNLTKATSGGLPPDLKQTAAGFLPQILAAQAASLPPKDPGRAAAYDSAIQKFTDYINTYPQAADLESIVYNRATAEYQAGKYDEATQDLKSNLQHFPRSGTLAASKNLLAIVVATQGSQLLNQHPGADKSAALALYKQATDYLKEIIDRKEDISLLNEANFHLGEILFNEAAFLPAAERPAVYRAAAAAYRGVQPKDLIVKWQNDVVLSFPDKKRRALLQKNDALRKQLDKDNEREIRKLANLQGEPDETGTALLKLSEIYLELGQPNESRVVLHHVMPFLTSDADKKHALYLLTMTYAAQTAADPAVKAYGDFQSKYRGDPVAENLPLTLGIMYNHLDKPADAVHYFDESLAIYPSGHFADRSVIHKAEAESRLGHYPEARQALTDFLSKNPTSDSAAIAQEALASSYRATHEWDQAIAAYKVLQQKYAASSPAEKADYWIATCTQQKGDNTAAIPLLDAYVQAHPNTPDAALALYSKATAQLALGQQDNGLATLALLADQFPLSPPAPFTYFVRARVLAQKNDQAQIAALMKQFIAKYPADDKIFSAYDYLSQTEIAGGQTDAALATLREFVQKYAQSSQAPEALIKIGEMQRKQAESLGRYGALNDQEHASWKTFINGSTTSFETVLNQYPASKQVARALHDLLQVQHLQVEADLEKAADVQAYFQALADKTSDASAKSKILFTLASSLPEKDAEKAFSIMQGAYQPTVLYSPASLEIYGLALIDRKQFDQAKSVFEKLAQDYPLPAGSAAKQAPLPTQEAQASSLFGLGQLAQAQGQVAEAGKYFEQLKNLYPWSPKVLEANYGIAASFKSQAKYDDALALLGGIIRAPNATSGLRARSMLLGGYITEAKMKAATDPKQKAEFLGDAIDYFIKIAQFYAGEPTAAAEGLWKGSQLLEDQANASTDPKFKTQQLTRAKSFYQQLVHDYPDSPFAAKAQERVAGLGTP